MSMAEEDKELEIVPDDDQKDADLDVEVESEKPPKQEDPDPTQILKEQLAAAQRERDEVKTAHQRAEEERRRLEGEVRTKGETERGNQRAILEHAIMAEESKAELAERALAEAMAAGDFSVAAKQQRAIADAAAKVANMRIGLDSFEADATEEKKATKETATEPTVDQRISQFTPRSQTWLKQHQDDIFGDQSRSNMAYAGHVMALNAGIAVDSDEYFEYLDKHMGYVNKEGGELPKPAAGNFSAPPNRHAAPAGSATQVRLTAEERDIAEAMGMTVKEYAAAKMAIAKGETHMSFSKEGER